MKLKVNDKRKLINKANSQIFLAVILSSVVVSAGLVSLKFLNDLRNYQSRVIAAQEETRDQLIANIESANEISEAFVEFDAGEISAEEVLSALPSKYDYPALATSIDKLAGFSDATLESFAGEDEEAEISSSVQVSAQPEPYEIQLSMSVTGSYKDIQNYLKVLERSIRPMKINDLSLSGSDSNMEADLSVSTYYQPKDQLEFSKRTIQ